MYCGTTHQMNQIQSHLPAPANSIQRTCSSLVRSIFRCVYRSIAQQYYTWVVYTHVNIEPQMTAQCYKRIPCTVIHTVQCWIAFGLHLNNNKKKKPTKRNIQFLGENSHTTKRREQIKTATEFRRRRKSTPNKEER